MAGFGAYRPRFARQLTARLRRPSTTSAAAAPAAGDEPLFKPRGRTHYADETTTVVGRTLTSPNGTFRIADLDSFRPVPQIEARERAKDATWMAVFAIGLIAGVGIVTLGIYTIMASKFGDGSWTSLLATAIVTLIILTMYVAVVLARWRVVYDRDPVRYRHVIVAVHRGESVAITPDLPYETADRIVAVLHKVKRKIPRTEVRVAGGKAAAA
jgi:hypothetical protein